MSKPVASQPPAVPETQEALTPELQQEITTMLRVLNETASGRYGKFSQEAKNAYDMIHQLRLKLMFPKPAAVPVQDALTTLLERFAQVERAFLACGDDGTGMVDVEVAAGAVRSLKDELEAALRREPPAVRTEPKKKS